MWRTEILNILHYMGLSGNPQYFLSTFVNHWRVLWPFHSEYIKYIKQAVGVCQGSVLNVTCFTVAINDIDKLLSDDLWCTLYLDDFMILF